MIFIGVDPHKSSHTAAALPAGQVRPVAVLRVPASQAGYTALQEWAQQFDDRVWAVENAHGLGHHLSQWLIGRGESVVDVPAAASARVRELSRGRGRKTDPVDAAAVALVASHRDDTTAVARETGADVLGLLDERRDNLARQRVRVVNQLHALLLELLPGGLGTHMTADRAETLIAAIRPVDHVAATRLELAAELIEDLRIIDARLDSNRQRIAAEVARTPTSLTEITGVGPIIAGRLLGRVGDPRRFPTAGHFASYAGAAPIEVSSGEIRRHRLSRAGDRQLNCALHMIAIVQVRITDSYGHAYFHRKLGEGKTKKEALRCLKRRLAEVIWKKMIHDLPDRPTDQAPAAA